jgi:hypothetical protein
LRRKQGLESSIITHADFGGVTSAIHNILSYKNVDSLVFTPPPALFWVLVHIINAALPNAAKEIGKPTPLLGLVLQMPIKENGVLQQEGLLDVFGAPNMRIACPCMFKSLGWAQ